MTHIKEVETLVANIEDYILRSSGKRLVNDMKEREAIASDKNITKLRKLKRLTSWRTYEFKEDHYGAKYLGEPHKIALRHTVHLIANIIKFDTKEIVKENTVFTRDVDGFTAVMVINEWGFHLVISNGEKTILDRTVGEWKATTGFGRDWVKTIDTVWKEVDLGLWRRNASISSDIFEVTYRVNRGNIEAIKTKLRKAFVENGLMTSERLGEGVTVGNAKLIGRTTYDDVISIRKMVHGDSVQDFVDTMLIANAVLQSEGYTLTEKEEN